MASDCSSLLLFVMINYFFLKHSNELIYHLEHGTHTGLADLVYWDAAAQCQVNMNNLDKSLMWFYIQITLTKDSSMILHYWNWTDQSIIGKIEFCNFTVSKWKQFFKYSCFSWWCSTHIRPICLPNQFDDVSDWHGRMCTTVGWGKLFELGRIFRMFIKWK